MRKPRRRIGISIDMTPMVDIAFLLLIFFMCTTQFKPPEKDKITLPDSSSPAKSPESDIITISITATPTVKVIYRKGGEELTQELNPATLQTDLGLALKTARAANPAARVLLKMDKDATYGVMADMITGLQEANATRFNVQTNLKGGANAFSNKPAGEQ
jgi:biopolymer transport protein ExbD